MAQIGVKVTTSALAGRTNSGVRSGRFIVAGFTERGPSAPTLVRSLAAYTQLFGGRTAFNSALYDNLRTFWEEGGSEAVVVRVVGAGATAGTVTLEGADAPLVTLTAESAGAWSADVSVSVQIQPATGFAPEQIRLVVDAPGGSESFLATSTQGIIDAVNARSAFVKATPAAEDVAAQLSAVESVALSAGDDKRGSVTAEDAVAALNRAGLEWGTAAVALPGYPAQVVAEGLLAHAARFSRVALMAPQAGSTAEDAIGVGAELMAADKSEYGALLFPYLSIPDGTATRLVSPEGFAAAKRAVAHSDVGPWRAPAGDFALAEWILGTEVAVDSSMNERLADARVTAIMSTGDRTRPYGWWSLSPDTDRWDMLTSRDTLNTLAAQCSDALEEFVFQPIDGRGLLTGQIESTLVGILDPISRANGVFPMSDADGNELDPGYRVVVDDTINTMETISEGRIVARVSVRLAPAAKLIEVEIVKAPFAGAL